MNYCSRESLAQREYQADRLILLILPLVSGYGKAGRTWIEGQTLVTSYAKDRREKMSAKAVPPQDPNEGQMLLMPSINQSERKEELSE